MNHALTLDFDQDYRVVFQNQEFFIQAVQDAYIGSSSHEKAPNFIDLLVNLSHAIAYFYFINNEHNFQELSERSKELVEYELMQGRDVTTEYVLEYVEEVFIEVFARDLHIYLQTSGYHYVEYEYNYPEVVRIFNAPFNPTW